MVGEGSEDDRKNMNRRQKENNKGDTRGKAFKK